VTIPAENNDVLRPDTQVTITGRNVEVPDHFAERVHAKLAKIAVTPPVVGCVKQEINNCPLSLCRFAAAEVFAICISFFHCMKKAEKFLFFLY